MAKKNVRNAAVAGGTASGLGAFLVAWGAAELSKATGLPAELCAGLLATPVAVVSGWVAHWAAKLNPND